MTGEAERRQITGRAGIVAAGTLASRLLGLVRDQVLAAVFSRAATDAFTLAFTIPNVLRQLLAEGAMQSAVLPVLTETRERQGEEAAREFFRALRGLSLLVLIAVTILGIAFAPAFVDLFASGFRERPDQYQRTVTLTRWLFPYVLLMGIAALGVAALNTYRRFIVTSFAPALLNVSFIVFALALPGWLGATGHDEILAMAFGALVGGLLQVVAQWPSLKRIGYLRAPRIDFRHPAVREVLRRMGPVLIGIGIYEIDVVLSRRFLSELPEGANSYFYFAQRLCDFPQGIFVMALQTATLPSLAVLAAQGDKDEVAETFAFGMRLSLFVGLAATALFIALAEPLIALIFQRGQFGAVDVAETARSLMALALGIWTVAAVRQLVAVYYALGDTRTPVIVSAIDLLVFIVLAVLLKARFGHVGVALAVSGASAAQMLLLWVLLKGRLADIRMAKVAISALRSAVAAVFAGVLAWGATRPLERLLSGDAWHRLLPGAAGSLVFGVAFLLFAWILKSEELATITRPIGRRLRARKG